MKSALILIALSLIAPIASADQVKPQADIRMEVERMMKALGWDRMVKTSLERGSIQQAAKAKIGNADSSRIRCVNEKYTETRVLSRISEGYLKVYSDPAIVSGITQFMGQSGGQKILEKIAARSKEVGARAAYEEGKSGAIDLLTSDEREAFARFEQSPAGKAYVKMRPLQLKVHQQELAALADEVAHECSK